MSVAQYRITGGFDEAQLKDIRDGAVRVLGRVGMKVDHAALCERLVANEGVTVEGGRVFFGDDLCEKYLAMFREEEKNAPTFDPIRLEGPWYPSMILDADAGKARPGTRDDTRRLVRLCNALDVERRIAPLAPKDVAPALEAVTAWKIALENGDRVWGGPLQSLDDFEVAMEMAEAAKLPGAAWCTEVTISPLTINPQAMDLVLRHVDGDMAMRGEPGPMISCGCTGPVFAPAFFIQAVAEWLGAYIVLKLVSGDRLGNDHEFHTLFNGGLRFEPMHFDMRSAAVAFGTPESLLFRLAARQVFRYLGGNPQVGGAMRTCSKELDAQNIAERSMNALAEAMDGVRCFCAAGTMANDWMVSPELIVIDREIVRIVERVVRGLDVVGDVDQSVETIASVVETGNFLEHETTMLYLRDTYSFSELFDTRTYAQWEAARPPSLIERARRIMDKALESYEFELPAEARATIDAIYDRYRRAKGL